MTWKKRETSGEITKLGDAEGHVKKAGGRLVAIRDGKYDNRLFVLEQEDASVLTVAGNTMMEEQIQNSDIGKFVKMEFDGWGESKSGNRYKEIYVYFWDGELSERMKAWGNGGERPIEQPVAAPVVEEPPIGDEPEDDLPF